MPSQGLLPGWTIPQWQDVDETPLPKNLPAYHLPVELHTMAEQLRHYPATLGCELTLIFIMPKTGITALRWRKRI